MTTSGNLVSVNGYSTTSDTSYQSTNNSNTVKIKNDSKQFFKVNDDVWTRAGKEVSLLKITQNRTPGSTSNYTVNYTGTIKSKFLIEGTYTINYQYVSSPHYILENETGNFSIEHNK